MAMSRAYKTNIMAIRKRFKKPRTPEEEKFMKLFGATDLFSSYSHGFDNFSQQDQLREPQISSDIPISMSLPMSLDELSSLSVSEQKEIYSSVHEPALPVMNKHVVSALESGADPDELSKDTETSNVRVLVGILEEMGQKVKEVKVLPAGGTKITLADLMGSQKVREPELVGVGGR